MIQSFSLDSVIALLTLAAMEIVLGIDNIVFVSILVAKLPNSQREQVRKLGISLALILRIALLFSISWVMALTQPLIELLGKSLSGRDLILLGGGAFLIAKATLEIHAKLEGPEEQGTGSISGREKTEKPGAFASILLQILALDIVFSLDSVITAVGMASQISIMIIAMIIAVGVMLISARAVGDFVHNHPTIKILALSFLILIGVMLVAEGMGNHVDKGYIYFAMSFSLIVEILNLRLRKKTSPIQLRQDQIR